MKVNVLRIDEENIKDNEREYNLNYTRLITNNTLELRKDGHLIVEDIVTEMFQDEFNFLRITTIGGETKFIIDTIRNVNLEKDLKTQQVKDILKKLNEKHSVVIEIENGKYVIRLEENFLYEYPTEKYTSKDNESLEDFILRVGTTFVNNK